MTAAGFLARDDFNRLIQALHELHYKVIGPRAIDNVIQFKEITDCDELPLGLIDDQQNGAYTLKPSSNKRFFEWCNGPQAVKPLLFQPREALWRVARNGEELQFTRCEPASGKTALIGARACDLAAVQIQDRHFLDRDPPDSFYQSHRENLLLIAVNCIRAAATCFCASTGDGPKVTHTYDISLSELKDGFILASRSDRGLEVLNKLGLRAANKQQIKQAEKQTQNATRQQRALPDVNYVSLIAERHDHPQWDTVSQRCLSCGNCTMVCPTCFCFNSEHETALDGSGAVQYRQWDSCFTRDHSYIHGIVIREHTTERYRQWLTHKFSSWVEQYERIGCVGCGRCITWCPVGIDVTEEIGAVCAGEAHA